MCAPGCMQIIKQRLSRRGMMAGAAGGVALAATSRPSRAAEPRSFSQVFDLTHKLSPEFPTYFGVPGIAVEQKFAFAESGFNLNEWSLNEHTGTHLDAPLHFSADGHASDEVPVERLVAPLAIIDIAARAEGDADAQVTPEDIKAWIGEHGPLPAGACIAMHSGWARHASGEMFRNADADGVLHFPGFHVEAASMLMEEADIVGMAVDTLSLDHGPSADFATHYAWLPTNRWGLENVANLEALPPTGATIIVGAPSVVGATGGPSRVLALV